MGLLKSLKLGIVPERVLNDSKLSLRAKGLYAFLYLIGKENLMGNENEEFYIDDIAKRTKEGKYAIESAIKELENNGYLIKKTNGEYTEYYLNEGSK